MTNIKSILSDFQKLRNPTKAKLLQGFFKTGKGEYGEGDVFLGIMVPFQRQLVKKYKDLSMNDIQYLLNTKVHEQRLTVLLILVNQYEHAKDEATRKKIFDFYLKNTKNINNWDLVDLTAPRIVGNYLLNRNRKLLYKMAKSTHLWDRRIAILATFTFIANHDFRDTLAISKILLKDKHDLIHKAVGWALREVGKRNQPIEESFLKKYKNVMPRTMLRYAIERFSPAKKNFYMKK